MFNYKANLSSSSAYLAWMENVPYLRIFVSLLLGVLSSRALPESWVVMGCALMFVSLVLLWVRSLRYYIIYVSIFMLGFLLPRLEENKELPLNEYIHLSFIVSDTTTQTSLYQAVNEEYGARVLLVFDKKLTDISDASGRSLTLKKGDTLSARVLMGQLSMAHFSLRREMTKPYSAFTANVLDSISVKSLQGEYHIKQSIFERANSWAERRLRCLSLDVRDIEVINGMLLGNRDELSSEVQEQYAVAGISHTLAISGMHIGVVFMLLNMLFSRVGSALWWRITYTLLIIGILSVYTLLVGSPVSAVRAVVMFSLMQCSLLRSHSPTQLFNSLFAVATFMLLYSSSVIDDLGFILSFTAVLSITCYVPLFQRFIVKRNIVIDIIILTLSAQILTTPIVLHYFGYFAYLSVFTNMLVSVLMPLILVFGLLFIVWPSTIIDAVLSFIFKVNNTSLEFVNSLSFASAKDVYFPTYCIIFYYIFMICLTDLLISSTKKEISSIKGAK